MKSFWSRHGNTLGLFIAWAVIFAALSLYLPKSFPTLDNVETLARQGTIVALAALGMTFVIVSGGIDLSVGSVVALVTVVVAAVVKAGYSPWAAVGAGLAVGGFCGLVNGLVITKLKVGPFIVTLGMLMLARGAAKGLAHQQKIDAPITWLNDLLAVLEKGQKWMLVPIGVWVLVVLSFLMAAVLNKTRFGRSVLAIGGNEQAARYAGIAVDRVRLMVYVLAGLFAGLAGLMLFARLSVGDPTAAASLELEVIAAAVIGGASLAGGQGTIAGALLGGLIMATIASGGRQMGLPNWIQEIVTGTIIIVAVGLDRIRTRNQAV